MGDWTTVVAACTTFIGLAAGYALGYRNGKVAGELAALKTERSDRHRFRPRERERTLRDGWERSHDGLNGGDGVRTTPAAEEPGAIEPGEPGSNPPAPHQR